MAEIGSAFVSILPSAKGFGSKLQSQTGGETSKAGGFLGGLLGKGLLAGFVAVGVAAGIGKALYEVGSTFDDLSDTIRINTGKSGAALDALSSVAEEVGQRVPVAFEQVGPVVADLNRRLNLTGKPLEKLSEQFLQLGHITGEQIDIPAVTGALNLFQVKAGQTRGVMDSLFQVTQSTGIGFGELVSVLQSNGAALTQFGFGIKQSAVLVGSLDKAGIDASRTLAAMRTALAKFAKDGKDPQKALFSTIEQIQGFIKAGDKAKAIDLAASIFGTRGASQFVTAVQSGRLSVEQLTKANTGSRDTIQKAAKDTADFSERWQMFKNRVLVGFEPVATKVFNAVGQAAKDLTPTVKDLARQFQANVVPVLRDKVAPIMRQLGEVIRSFVLPALAALAGFYVSKVVPAILTFQAALANKVIPALRTAAVFIATQVVPKAVAFAQVIGHNLKPALDQLIATAASLGAKFRSDVLPPLQRANARFQEAWPTIRRVIEVTAKLVAGFIRLNSAVLGKVLPPLIRLAGFLAGNMLSALGGFIDLNSRAGLALVNFGRKLVAAIQDAVKFAKGVVQQGQRVLHFFQDLPGKIKSALGNAGTLLVETGKNIIRGLINGIKAMAKQAADAAIAVVKGAIDKAEGFLHIKSPSRLTYEMGVNVGEGFARGIESTTDRVGQAAEKMGKKVKEKLAALRDKLAGFRSDFASLVDPIASNFTQGLFEFDTAGAFAANLTTVKGTLKTLLDSFQKLKGEGLSPGFLYQLFQSGGPGLINSLANLDTAGAQNAASLFGQVTDLSNQLGTAVAGATDKGVALENQTRRLEAKLDKLIHHVDRVGSDVGREVNGAAGRGHRRGRDNGGRRAA